MSQRNWLAATAFGLISFVCVLSPPHDSRAGSQKDKQGVEIEIPFPPLRLVYGPEEAKETEQPCKPKEDNRNSDLCAQWKAADAAKESADWTRRTFYLGLGGLVVGGFTLGAAFAAARYAKRAAVATEDTVEAAREVSRDQSRAYLHIERVQFWTGGDNRNPRAMAWIKNTGQTPAKWFYLVSTANLYPIDYTHPFAVEVDVSKDRGVTWNALAGDGAELSAPISISDVVMGQIRDAATNSGTHQIIVSGVVQYETLFSEIFETEFMFVGKPLPTYVNVKMPEDRRSRNGGLIVSVVGEEPHNLKRAGRRLSSYKRLPDQEKPE